MSLTAEIISVGTELLLGETINSDAAMISKELADIGIDVFHHSAVGDNRGRIKEIFQTALNRSDIIIVTGGLGPTYDDITKATIAEQLNLKLEKKEEIIEDIKRYFKNKAKDMPPNNELQALIPQGATVLKNDWGTAPGVMIEHKNKKIFMLPGPPFECKNMMIERVVPILSKISEKALVSRYIRIIGRTESETELLLRDIMTKGVNPTVAPYVKDGEILVRVTASAKTKDEAFKLTEPIVKEIQQILGNSIYAVDIDSPEEVLVNLLKEKKMTISCAESCTGGGIAHKITAVAGASNVFPGGIVSYSEKIKENILGVDPKIISSFGVVSKETAEAMAKKCCELFKTDLAIAVTGYAGPSFGENDSAGHVFISVFYNGKNITNEFNFLGTRERVRNKAIKQALKMAIEQVK